MNPTFSLSTRKENGGTEILREWGAMYVSGAPQYFPCPFGGAHIFYRNHGIFDQI